MRQRVPVETKLKFLLLVARGLSADAAGKELGFHGSVATQWARASDEFANALKDAKAKGRAIRHKEMNQELDEIAAQYFAEGLDKSD